MDRRVLPAVAAGMGGLAAGAGAAVLGARVLGALAGVGAFMAAWAALPLIRRVQWLEQARRRPSADPLVDLATGLPGARSFEVAVDSRLRTARRRFWPLAVVLVEIGYRVEGNGAEAGDEARTAAVLRRVVRDADDVCRVGNHRFGLVLEDAGESDARHALERVRVALTSEVAGLRRLAAGVAVYPSHGLHDHDVLLQARRALERAILAGGEAGRVEVARLETA